MVILVHAFSNESNGSENRYENRRERERRGKQRDMVSNKMWGK